MIEFKLPFIGADVDEGKLLQWTVRPGDTVKRGQVVAVVDTSKAAVDVESFQEGTVFELLVSPGEKVPVGAVLATLLEPGETAESARRMPHAEPVAGQAPVPSPGPTVPASTETAAAPVHGRRRVSPAARKHAEDYGLEIDMIAGTGPDGAVLLQDVEQAAAERQTATAHPAAPSPDIKKADMRRAIAAAMSRSKRDIPHYYLQETVPMRNAQTWLAATNTRRDVTARLLMATLQLKAVAMAAMEYPDMNGFFVDGTYRASRAVHIGVAISLRQGGLIAPAIHDVNKKTLDEIMRDLADLARRARAGSLRSSEMSDPTITVTNLGDQGVESVFGVIYPPQVALVGFGRIREQAWAEDGALRAMPATIASLSADHRVSDGHYGALFLANVRDRLQDPNAL